MALLALKVQQAFKVLLEKRARPDYKARKATPALLALRGQRASKESLVQQDFKASKEDRASKGQKEIRDPRARSD
jgi:hypothetical protein